MDAIGIWLLVLILLPFLLFFCRILLIAWKSVILSRRIKILSNEIDELKRLIRWIFDHVGKCSPGLDDSNSQNQPFFLRISIKSSVTPGPSLAMASNNSLNWTVPTFPVLIDPPVIIYPTESTPVSVDYSTDVYSYIVVIFVLVSILAITKVAISRKQSLNRRAALRDARARQNQVPTVSGAVDGNTPSDTPTTSQQPGDVDIKVDLPPTYEEVMKTFLDAKEAAAASSGGNPNVTEQSTRGLTEIDIEEPPPPQYNTIQSS